MDENRLIEIFVDDTDEHMLFLTNAPKTAIEKAIADAQAVDDANEDSDEGDDTLVFVTSLLDMGYTCKAVAPEQYMV